MFCRTCGKEIQEEWTCCPNCGEKIHIKDDVSENNTIEGNIPKNITTVGEFGNTEILKEQKTDFTLGKTPISGKLLLKILSLIALTCFFCPLYMTSCAGQELIALDGPMLTFGFEYMGETIDGILIFGILAVLPIIIFICAFAGKSVSVKMLNYKSYSVAVCACTLYGFIAVFTDKLQSAMSENEVPLKVEPCTALKVLTVISLISAVIGGYLMFLTEPRKKETSSIIVAVKCIAKIVVASIILLVIIMLPYRTELRPSTIPEDYKNEYEEAITKVDLSDYDMKDFIGESRETMEELGFEEGIYDGTSLEYDENDKVDRIYIEQGEESAPSFYGVSLGMERQEAEELLVDLYPTLLDMEDEGFIRVNNEKREEVYCECEEGKVSTILYCVLSEEELLEFREENSNKEYIFPDSDKKYLSEDEVRSIAAEDMAIGRNEIFARHGYIFQDEGLKAYFEGTSWYEGTVQADQFNSDAVFNDFEKKNVELIKRVEDEINGVGQAVEPFIGITGTYQCGSSLEAGVIDVYVIDNSSINIIIGTHGQPALLGGVGGGMPGNIINSNTAVIDWGAGCVFTLTWSEAGRFTITHTGSTGWDNIDEITNHVEYVEANYYGVS